MTASRTRATALALVVLLIGLTALVQSGATNTFDMKIATTFRNAADGSLLGPRWFQEAARDVTGLGSLTVLGLLFVLSLVLLSAATLRRCAAVLAISVSVGVALCFAAKIPVARPRPDLTHGAPQVFTASFPSAHAMTSAILFGLLALMLRRAMPRRPALGRCAVAGAIFVCLLIGLSRIYLGVHWATDILAGWLAGLFWILLSWHLGRRFCLAELDGRATDSLSELQAKPASVGER